MRSGIITLLTQTLGGPKEKFNLWNIIYIHTSVQGPRTPVELVKDYTKGIVDLKRVHCTSVQGPRTPVELVKDYTKGIVDLKRVHCTCIVQKPCTYMLIKGANIIYIHHAQCYTLISGPTTTHTPVR